MRRPVLVSLLAAATLLPAQGIILSGVAHTDLVASAGIPPGVIPAGTTLTPYMSISATAFRETASLVIRRSSSTFHFNGQSWPTNRVAAASWARPCSC